MNRTARAAAVLLLALSTAACAPQPGEYDCHVSYSGGASAPAAAVTCAPVTSSPTATPTEAPTDPPTEEPTDPPTDEPTSEPTPFHGEDITRANVGPQGTLTAYSWSTNSTPRTLDHVDISTGITLGADFTCTDCRITGSAGTSSAGYTVKLTTAPAGTDFRCVRCEIVTLNDFTKGIATWGERGIHLERTIMRGGTDNIYAKPDPNAAASKTVDGVAYAVTVVESLLTDQDRTDGSHTDAIQIDGGAGGVLVLRSRIQSCTGNDSTAAVCDTLSSGGVILTYPSSNPLQIDRVRVADSCVLGGNWTLDSDPPDGPTPTDVVITGNRFGPAQFGALHTGTGQIVSGNHLNACSAL